MKAIRALLCLLAVPAFLAAAPACVTGTLTDYIGLPSGGCLVGTISFEDFSFSVIGSGGTGVVVLGPSDITVSPELTLSGSRLRFSAPFSVIGDQFTEYLIEYLTDPPPPIIHGWDEEMFAESPVAPGYAQIDTFLCPGGPFDEDRGEEGVGCRTAPVEQLTILHDGSPAPILFDSVDFGATYQYVGVRTFVKLVANGASSDIDGWGARASIVPEPSTFLLGGAALIALGWLRRKRG